MNSVHTVGVNVLMIILCCDKAIRVMSFFIFELRDS